MKALLCLSCYDIRGLPPDRTPATCRCGNVTARWENPLTGTVRVQARDRATARILGLNNRMLTSGARTDEEWKVAHWAATQAPGFVFDQAHRNCWAAILRVGETADVDWEEETDG